MRAALAISARTYVLGGGQVRMHGTPAPRAAATTWRIGPRFRGSIRHEGV